MHVCYFLTLSINLTRHDRLIRRIHPPSALHRFMLPHFPLQMHRTIIEAHHPAFSCQLCRTYADLEEDVEVEPIDLDDADDADGSSNPAPLSRPALAALPHIPVTSSDNGTRGIPFVR